MPGGRAPGSSTGNRSISELLAGMRLSGRTWCYADLGGAAGLAVAPSDAVHIHVVIHGSVRLSCVSGVQLELGPGDAAAMLTGEAHALRTQSGARAEPLEFLRAAREADVPPAFVLGDGGRTAARVLSARLGATWPADAARSALPAALRLTGPDAPVGRDALAHAAIGPGATALLTRLAETLVVAALRREPGCRSFLSRHLDDPIGEALQLIAGNPSRSWTVESLARAVGMGRSNFAAQFTQRLGQAPMEVVTARRMDAAADLLAEGRMKLAEIAELAGYGSEAAFSRRFTRHFGTTPSRHREIARQQRAQQPEEAPRFRPLLGPAPSLAQPLPADDRARKPAIVGERRHATLLREPRG